MNYRSVFEGKEGENIFIKTTSKPAIGSGAKAALNRQGNIHFNAGNIENARRIFITTGYSDGLIRVGNHYSSKGRLLDALRMYWMAPDRNRAEPIIMRLSILIQSLLKEDLNHD